MLIVAGSDSGGGAGIQADIRAVTLLGGHAMTAIAAITAQNTVGVQGVHPVPADMVVAQMRSVVEDIGVDAVKIGMIGSAETANAVADFLTSAFSSSPRKRGPTSSAIAMGAGQALDSRCLGNDEGETRDRASIPIVFDPVMIATSGGVLADAETIAAFDRLMRLATLTTPNLPELAALGGIPAIAARGGAVLAKGGHAEGDIITDRLFDASGAQIACWVGARIDSRHTHGTGCTLASGIATGLGQGMALPEAIARARDHVRAAISSAPGLGQGSGPLGNPGIVPPPR